MTPSLMMSAFGVGRSRFAALYATRRTTTSATARGWGRRNRRSSAISIAACYRRPA